MKKQREYDLNEIVLKIHEFEGESIIVSRTLLLKNKMETSLKNKNKLNGYIVLLPFLNLRIEFFKDIYCSVKCSALK